MKHLLALFIFFILILPTNSKAQNQKIFLLESGATPLKGAKTSINYVSKWNDSLFGEIGVLWFNKNLSENINGDLGINGRISYRLDFLSIIPSLYIGLATGLDLSDTSQNFTLFEYGVIADYMYSRKLYFGLGFSGFSHIKTNTSAVNSNTINSTSSFLINFRITWIAGEEW